MNTLWRRFLRLIHALRFDGWQRGYWIRWALFWRIGE